MCKCIEEFEKLLNDRDQTIQHHLAINFSRGTQEFALHTKSMSGKRKKELLVFNYCPLCGKEIVRQ